MIGFTPARRINMKGIKAALSAFLVILVTLSLFTGVFAYDSVYNDLLEPMFANDFNVGDQGESGDCLYYALLATAESFVKKYYSESVDFSETSLIERLNDEKRLDFVIGGLRDNPELMLENATASPYAVASIESSPVEDDYSFMKKTIKEYGAVTAVFGVCDEGMTCGEHYDPESCSYYCPEERCGEDTHAVAVIGWDDNYNGGCWICKNSYGYDYGKAGFFCLSYNQKIYGMVKMTVSRNGETAELTEDDNWSSDYITALFVQVDSSGNKQAYGITHNGKTVACEIHKDSNTNYYIIEPPANAFFDRETVCYYNGSESEYGFSTSNEEGRYEFENGLIKIESKAAGGYKIVKVETYQFGVSSVKLIYDNYSEKMIFDKDFNEKRIEVAGEYGSAEECAQYGLTNLPPLQKGQKYTVLKFDGDLYKFDTEKVANISERDGWYYIAVSYEIWKPMVAVKNLAAMLSTLIESFLGIFSGLAMAFSSR